MKRLCLVLTACLLLLGLCACAPLADPSKTTAEPGTVNPPNIIAGTLDVECEYLSDGMWKSVSSDTRLFERGAVWAPMRKEIAYLRIRNTGTLALKFRFNATVASEVAGKNHAGEELRYSDHLCIAAVQSEEHTPFVGSVSDLSDAVLLQTGLTVAREELLPGDEVYLALVLWMPATTPNSAASGGAEVPAFDVEIQVLATQATSENESFGSDYDS